MTVTTYPARVETLKTPRTARELDDWEWSMIQRLRQMARAGEGEQALVDPRTRTLRVIPSRLEKLDT